MAEVVSLSLTPSAFSGAVTHAVPAVRFVAGSSGFYWMGWAMVGFAALFVLVLTVALFTVQNPPLRIFLSVPVMLVVGGGFIKQGRVRIYDPAEPPADLLPPVG